MLSAKTQKYQRDMIETTQMVLNTPIVQRVINGYELALSDAEDRARLATESANVVGGLSEKEVTDLVNRAVESESERVNTKLNHFDEKCETMRSEFDELAESHGVKLAGLVTDFSELGEKVGSVETRLESLVETVNVSDDQSQLAFKALRNDMDVLTAMVAGLTASVAALQKAQNTQLSIETKSLPTPPAAVAAPSKPRANKPPTPAPSVSGSGTASDSENDVPATPPAKPAPAAQKQKTPVAPASAQKQATAPPTQKPASPVAAKSAAAPTQKTKPAPKPEPEPEPEPEDDEQEEGGDDEPGSDESSVASDHSFVYKGVRYYREFSDIAKDGKIFAIDEDDVLGAVVGTMRSGSTRFKK